MHININNFHQGEEYFSQIASHRSDLRREGKFNDEKYLSIESLQTDYLNIVRNSGCGKNNERADLVRTKCTFCGYANHYTDKCLKG